MAYLYRHRAIGDCPFLTLSLTRSPVTTWKCI